MILQHVNVKFFVDGELAIDWERLIEVFHRWVGEQSMDELLIDVADYRHVPSGPGVVVVGHDADYALDNTRDRYGLRYNRKAPLDGSNSHRFRQAVTAAANACRLLEAEFENLKFNRQEIELSINDRGLAPNTPETFAACKPELETFLTDLQDDNAFNLRHDDSDPRRLFRVTITFEKPIDLSHLAGG